MAGKQPELLPPSWNTRVLECTWGGPMMGKDSRWPHTRHKLRDHQAGSFAKRLTPCCFRQPPIADPYRD